VNSDRPHEEYLIPLRLTWDDALLQVKRLTYPKATDEIYEFSQTPLSVFSREFRIGTLFDVPASVPPGSHIVVGKLRYQACNNTTCFPPKTVEVKLPVEIE